MRMRSQKCTIHLVGQRAFTTSQRNIRNLEQGGKTGSHVRNHGIVFTDSATMYLTYHSAEFPFSYNFRNAAFQYKYIRLDLKEG